MIRTIGLVRAQATVMLVDDVLSLQVGLNLFVFGYGFLVVAAERMDQGPNGSAGDNPNAGSSLLA